MSTDAVGADLMSLLKMFSSPRMGPFENTNTTTPFPPGSDQARQQSDPSRYGGGQPPSSGPPPGAGVLPPGFPQPVARRVVPPDGGDPRADQPAPGAAIVAGKGPAGTAPAGEDLQSFMNTQPDYIAYLAHLRKRQAEAAQEQALANVFGGLSEFADARSGGGGGGRSQSKLVETPKDEMTLGQFGEFQKRKEGLLATAEDNKRIDSIVADPRVGGRISKEALLTLRANNPPAYAKLVADFFDPQTDTKILEDGTFVSRAKNAPAGTPYLPTGTVDTAKGEKSAADLAKVKIDTAKTQAEIPKVQAETTEVTARTEKLNQEISQGKINPALQSDASLKIIAKTLAQDPNDPKVIETLRSMGIKELQETWKQTIAAGAARNDPREWESVEVKEQQAGRKKIQSSLGQIQTYENLQKILAENKPRMGSESADWINSYYRNINTIFGSPLDEKTLGADAFRAQAADLVRQAVKDYGANPSNSDRLAAMQQFGADTPPEVAKLQLGLVLKAKVWEVQKHNANIQDRLDNTDMSASNKNALKNQMVKMPAPTDSTLRAMNIPPGEVAVLKSTIGTPEEAEARATFEKRHGRVLGEWALGEISQ